MANYVLKLKPFRFEQHILDDKDRIIGYANRYWNNIGQLLSMLVDPCLLINIKIENEKRELVLRLKNDSHLFKLRKSWTGTIYNQDKPDTYFNLTLDPKLKVGFFMDLQIGEKLIFIKDRTLGTEPDFLDSDNNILAKCRDNLVGKVDINIVDPDLDVYLVSAITYLMRQY